MNLGQYVRNCVHRGDLNEIFLALNAWGLAACSSQYSEVTGKPFPPELVQKYSEFKALKESQDNDAQIKKEMEISLRKSLELKLSEYLEEIKERFDELSVGVWTDDDKAYLIKMNDLMQDEMQAGKMTEDRLEKWRDLILQRIILAKNRVLSSSDSSKGSGG